MTTFEKS